MKKSMYGTRDAASNLERAWQEHVKSWSFQLGLSSKNLFHQERHQVSGMTHGDDFVLPAPTERLTEFEKKMDRSVSNKGKNHQLRVNGKQQRIEQKAALGKARKCVSARSHTR